MTSKNPFSPGVSRVDTTGRRSQSEGSRRVELYVDLLVSDPDSKNHMRIEEAHGRRPYRVRVENSRHLQGWSKSLK